MTDRSAGAGRSLGRKRIQPSARPRELMTPTPDLNGVWTARVITLFPEVFPGVLGASLTGKALKEGVWQLETIDLRAFGAGRHRNVDDTPTGGGAGMVLRADVLGNAIDQAMLGASGKWPLIYFSPRGAAMTQALVQDLARADGATMICGRFEGIDERVLEHFEVVEVSLGDFVMTGGELAAQAMIDATVRLLPGVLGNQASAEDESFSNGLLEHPQYTRPSEWNGRSIPPVLLSGNHGEIERWRLAEARRVTKTRRPDLWAEYALRNSLSDPDRE